MIIRISAVFTLAASLVLTVQAKGNLFDNPLALFEKALVPALSHFEQAKIQTTLRGFYLRADTQTGFKQETSPSESGIYMDVEVRDAKEVPALVDTV